MAAITPLCKLVFTDFSYVSIPLIKSPGISWPWLLTPFRQQFGAILAPGDDLEASRFSTEIFRTIPRIYVFFNSCRLGTEKRVNNLKPREIGYTSVP